MEEVGGHDGVIDFNAAPGGNKTNVCNPDYPRWLGASSAAHLS